MRPERRGTALIVALVVVVVLALAAYGFLHVMQGEYRAARFEMDHEQARAAALSGAEAVAVWLERPLEERLGDEGGSGMLGESQEPFQAIALEATSDSETEGAGVADGETANEWSFSVLAAIAAEDESSGSQAAIPMSPSARGLGAEDTTEETAFRFGLENESAKINLRMLSVWESEEPGHARRVLEEIFELEASSVEAMLGALGIESFSAAEEPEIDGNGESASGFEARNDEMLDRDDALAGSDVSADNDVGSRDAGSTTGTGTDGDSRSSETGNRSQDRASLINRDPELETKVVTAMGESRWWGGDLDRNFRVESFEQALLAAESDAIGDTLGIGTGSATGSAASSVMRNAVSPGLSGSSALREGAVQRVLRNFFTFDSAERRARPDGGKPVDLNASDAAVLESQLTEIWDEEQVAFVLAYRAFGPSETTIEGDAVSGGARWVPPAGLELKQEIENPLDLVDVVVQVPAKANGGIDLWLPSPFRSDPAGRAEVARALLEEVDVTDETLVLGRISVNEAPAKVLHSVPGLDSETVERILEARSRPSSDPAARRSVGWIWSEGLVDLTTMRRVHRHLTAGGDVSSCQIVGFRDDVSPVYRLSATFDGTTRPARMVRTATWHAWGRGFTAAQLRGQTPSPASTSLPDRSP